MNNVIMIISSYTGVLFLQISETIDIITDPNKVSVVSDYFPLLLSIGLLIFIYRVWTVSRKDNELTRQDNKEMLSNLYRIIENNTKAVSDLAKSVEDLAQSTEIRASKLEKEIESLQDLVKTKQMV